ncbi:TPA: hypothetical protein ACH34K_000989 [Streptococcus agalactiae]|nr:hypothetical protein [Streptococcus agalactiae]HEN7063989.1 hypothetical protein [Streptococcus agalactiae]HES6063991.1 hypothetical protein [Streptococcus pyogenes]HES6581306.1 hypothetical protein [Streptococcus pyogenes]
MVHFYNEKDFIDVDYLKNLGLKINKRDTTTVYDEKTKMDQQRLNFVGIDVDKDNNMFVFLPYSYEVKSIKDDTKALMKTIYKHMQKRPELYFGKDSKEIFDSNYPFSSFFEVYDYYLNYGLYVEYKDDITIQKSGRLSWRNIIKKSQKYIINDNMFFAPLYYKKTSRSSTFISDCMSYVLEYTIKKFGNLLGLGSLGLQTDNKNFINYKDQVIRELFIIKSTSFNDITNKLIDSLIDFFKSVNIGGSYYLKHYNFAKIWEDMVTLYVNKKLVGINNKFLDLSGDGQENNFKKRTYYPNEIHPDQKMEPDCVSIIDNRLYILDAKYYEPLDIDYKQICYYLFLKNYYDDISEIYTSLISPSNVRKSDINFKMNEKFDPMLKDIQINIDYIDIREVMKFWNEAK